jgi:hypothetical protein
LKRLSLLAISPATALARADIQVSFDPAISTTAVGGTANVNLNISGAPACEAGNPANFPVGCTLGAFDASITYDQNIASPGAGRLCGAAAWANGQDFSKRRYQPCRRG